MIKAVIHSLFIIDINYLQDILTSSVLLGLINTSTKSICSTVVDDMDESGFNSKATFNTLFKKLVGMTPTQYRKELIKR